MSRADVERSDRSIDVYSKASSEPAEARVVVVVGVARQSPGCLSQRRDGRRKGRDRGGGNRMNRSPATIIFGEPYRPGMINVMAGTLDDPSVFVPTAEVFCDYAFFWLYDGGERPHLPRGFG